MKKESQRILLVEILLILVSFVQFFIIRRFSLWIYLIPILAIAIFSYFFIGLPKRAERGSKDVLLVLIIGCISYYLLIYFIGFFSGFLITGYGHTPLTLFQNIFPHLVFIILIEYIRSMVVKKGKFDKKIIILSVFAFFCVDVALKFSLLQVDSREAVLKVILNAIIPTLIKTALLTYITYTTEAKNSIVYHCLMELPVYIIPIFPDLGDYISNIFLIVQPMLMIVFIYKILYDKREKIENSRRTVKFNKYQRILQAFLVLLLVVVVVLVSGVGRYVALAIGSESMTGTIDKGDVIVIDKKDKNYKVGAIIAFEYDGRVLVHRIMEINETEKEVSYQTKGDYNKDKDAWVVKPETIIGVVKFRLWGIGWPTVKLSEWMEGDR